MSFGVKFLACILTFYLVTALYAFMYILRTKDAEKLDKGHEYRVVENNLKEPKLQLGFTRKFLSAEKEADEAVFTETAEERQYWNQWALSKDPTAPNIPRHMIKSVLKSQPKYTVDIWSNNGLGIYLWEHILQGEVKPVKDLLYSHGEKIIGDVRYRYKGGDRLNVAFLPDATDNTILVLNARDNFTASITKSWLDGLVYLELLQNVGLVLIGDERCVNDWILPYLLQKNASSPKFVYLVYDCPCVDGETIHQFPLGVATYRDFPLASYPELAVPGERLYSCNFMGTVYENSSRAELANIITSLNKRHSKEVCYLKVRQKWLAAETHEGLQSYLHILKSSDLTLCPVGKNAESYRIYEAMSVGSVPVLEDKSASPSCNTEPFRLLKHYKAPVLYVKTWSELKGILSNELFMTAEHKEKRRYDILTWYKTFRKNIAKHFTQQVESKFFGIQN